MTNSGIVDYNFTGITSTGSGALINISPQSGDAVANTGSVPYTAAIDGTSASAGTSYVFSTHVTDGTNTADSNTVSLTAVSQRVFSAGTPTIALGRFLVGVAPSGGSAAISSSGLFNATSSGTLGSFSGTGAGGLTLTTGAPTAFNGGSSTQTANYTVGGSVSTAGTLSGSFSAPVTAELGTIPNLTVNVTGDALNLRSVTASTLNLGPLHAGTNLNTLSETATFNSSGGSLTTTSVLVDGTLAFNGGSNTLSETVTGQNATAAASGTFYSAPVTSLESGLGDSYANVAVPYAATLYSGSGVWNAASSGNWNNPANWTAGGGVPGTSGPVLSARDTATFGAAGTSGLVTVMLNNTSPQVSALTFSGTSSYALLQGSGTGVLTLFAPSGPALVTVTSGSHVIAAPWSWPATSPSPPRPARS